MQNVVGEVLSAHGFVAPAYVPGPDSGTWAFSGRARSAGELTLAVVKLSSARSGEVSLTAYAQVGSAWPILGRLFTRPLKNEEADMNRELRARLGE